MLYILKYKEFYKRNYKINNKHMAKKPTKRREPKLKLLIRRYILEIGEVERELTNSNLEFGFLFHYPKGFVKDELGIKIPRGRAFQANKPKDVDLLALNHRITISPEYVKILEALKEKKAKVRDDLIKLYLMKNVEYNINWKEYSILLSDVIYLDGKNYISINKFYKTIRNLFHTDFSSIMIIQKECSGKIDDKDVKNGFDSSYWIANK